MSGSTLSSVVDTGITLGYGAYSSPLILTSTAVVRDAGGNAVYVTGDGATLTNHGKITAGNGGIYLNGSDTSIANSGYVEGAAAGIFAHNFSGSAWITNTGTLAGANGVLGLGVTLSNTGLITGARSGIDLKRSSITNSGNITGQNAVYSTDGTLTNRGSIIGSSSGLQLWGGSATNFGSITGSMMEGALVKNTANAGSLVNYGHIAGGNYGVTVSGGFTNQGTVSGRVGLEMGAGATAQNMASALIEGSSYGAAIFGSAAGGATLGNAGTILGSGLGVTLGVQGKLVNSGVIYGPVLGAGIYDGYLVNSGSIGSGYTGVTLALGNGVVDNASGGTISGIAYGLIQKGGLVENYGVISGGTYGGQVKGGSLANSGTISGNIGIGVFTGATAGNYGVIAGDRYGARVGRGVITNAGTISGSVDAVTGSAITLAVEPHAVFSGLVQNTGGAGILEFGGVGFGTLGGIGSQITGFSEISFASGSDWSIEGIVPGLAQRQSIVGFARGDTITLDGFSASSEIFVKNVGLELSAGPASVTLDIAGNFSTSSFQIGSNGSNTVIVTCFVQGTRIRTPRGEVPVEALAIGDPVSTLHGGVQPVKWIGFRSYDGRFIRGNKAALPVCIKAGAIADNIPCRDLWVSPGHAISIDNTLVHAGRLVNGVSILQPETVEHVAYYHVELENHEILLAENCPAESFAGEAFRGMFVNAGEFRRRYPRARAPEILCQPRLDGGFQLHALQLRLRARAGLAEPQGGGTLRGFVDQAGPGFCFGWAQDVAAPELPVSLDIVAGATRIGRVLANLYRADVASAGYGSGYQGFELTLPADTGPVVVRRSTDGALLRRAA